MTSSWLNVSVVQKQKQNNHKISKNKKIIKLQNTKKSENFKKQKNHKISNKKITKFQKQQNF